MELSKNTTEALKLMTQAGDLFQQERKESYLFIASTTNSATKTEEESQNKTGAFCMQFGGNPQEIALALIGLMKRPSFENDVHVYVCERFGWTRRYNHQGCIG